MVKMFFTILLICLPTVVAAQNTYIRAGEVFDGINFIGGKFIGINNGLIEGIYDLNYVLPAGSEIIDATDCTILPGFIDSHIHFMGAPLPYVAEIEKYGFGRLACEGISLFPENRLHLLLNGITGIIDMGAPIKSYLKIDKAIQKMQILGPEIYYPGPLITAPKGHPASTYYKGQHDLFLNGTFQVSDISKAKREINWLSNEKVDFIKIVYDRAWYLKKGVPRLDLEIAKTITEEAHKIGLKVFAHVGSEEEAWDMIKLNVDGIEHGFKVSSDSVLVALRNSKIFFTPTLSAYEHYAPNAVKYMEEMVKKASLLNIPVLVGTDYPSSYGNYCGDDLFEEMNHLENIGLSRVEVLRGATYYGAEKIGKENEVGFIGKGYKANLIFYQGLADTGIFTSARLLRTMIGGKIIIDSGKISARYQPFFKTRKSLVFPYCFYDMVTEFNMGISYTNFSLFKTGTSLYADASRSLRNMWAANLQFFLPSPVRKTSLKASFHFDNQNRLFYGIGNNAIKETSIEYGSTFMKESLSAATSLNRKWKLFYSVSLDQFKTEGAENNIPINITGARGGNQTLLTFSLIYDSRDHQNNPWDGIMISVMPELSLKFLGSANNFSRLTLDIRGYFSPITRHILCGRLLFKQLFGNAPFNYLADFGGSSIGRGYYTSRFIDKAGIYAQGEYRFPVWKIISGIAFYDLGQVQDKPQEFRINRFRQNFGFGARFSFGSNENSILGMNFGFSDEGMMVSFSAGHSF